MQIDGLKSVDHIFDLALKEMDPVRRLHLFSEGLEQLTELAEEFAEVTDASSYLANVRLVRIREFVLNLSRIMHIPLRPWCEYWLFFLERSNDVSAAINCDAVATQTYARFNALHKGYFNH